MIQVTIYKSDGNKTFQNITSVNIKNGILNLIFILIRNSRLYAGNDDLPVLSRGNVWVG